MNSVNKVNIRLIMRVLRSAWNLRLTKSHTVKYNEVEVIECPDGLPYSSQHFVGVMSETKNGRASCIKLFEIDKIPSAV